MYLSSLSITGRKLGHIDFGHSFSADRPLFCKLYKCLWCINVLDFSFGVNINLQPNRSFMKESEL